jgi:hypothetical protein
MGLFGKLVPDALKKSAGEFDGGEKKKKKRKKKIPVEAHNPHDLVLAELDLEDTPRTPRVKKLVYKRPIVVQERIER